MAHHYGQRVPTHSSVWVFHAPLRPPTYKLVAARRQDESNQRFPVMIPHPPCPLPESSDDRFRLTILHSSRALCRSKNIDERTQAELALKNFGSDALSIHLSIARASMEVKWNLHNQHCAQVARYDRSDACLPYRVAPNYSWGSQLEELHTTKSLVPGMSLALFVSHSYYYAIATVANH